MTHDRVAAVLSHVRPVVMAAATSLIICGLFLWGIEARNNHRLYENQIESCKRGQILRSVVHEFLVAAEAARRTTPIDPGDTKTANEYRRLDEMIWPLRPCSKIVQRP